MRSWGLCLAIVCFALLGCEVKCANDSSDSDEIKHDSRSILVVAYDNDFNPKMCWKLSSRNQVNSCLASKRGYMSWQDGNWNWPFTQVIGNNVVAISVGDGGPLWDDAANRLGVKLVYCTDGKYVEKLE
ncbi:hypothetical protein HZB94_03370 [Candidatus Falkowbacteria bacterium]|nr:hypothetical protein [Candidatus Falkowbacteria bacterium]